MKNTLWELKSLGDVEGILALGMEVYMYGFHEKFNRELEKFYLSIGSFFEKNKLYLEALDFFVLSSIYPSKERMVRILDKQGNLEEAFDLCSSLQDSENYYEREFAVFFIEKIKKKLGQKYLKNTRKKYLEKTIELLNISNERVEDAVLKYYRDKGWVGFYSESKIWASITGILLWDVIFSARPNVFYNPFQRGPADLFSADFYLENKDELESIFEKFFYNPNWQHELLDKYEEKYLTANHLVDWKRVNIEVFKTVIQYLSIEDIIHLSRRLITNPAEFRSGLPDLFLIEPDSKKYYLVEVKGPGDQLQPNQRRWLKYFEENNIPYFVQKVKWMD